MEIDSGLQEELPFNPPPPPPTYNSQQNGPLNRLTQVHSLTGPEVDVPHRLHPDEGPAEVELLLSMKA